MSSVVKSSRSTTGINHHSLRFQGKWSSSRTVLVRAATLDKTAAMPCISPCSATKNALAGMCFLE